MSDTDNTLEIICAPEQFCADYRGGLVAARRRFAARGLPTIGGAVSLPRHEGFTFEQTVL
jgi:hypothetical protein